jgi:hypothetical protein
MFPNYNTNFRVACLLLLFFKSTQKIDSYHPYNNLLMLIIIIELDTLHTYLVEVVVEEEVFHVYLFIVSFHFITSSVFPSLPGTMREVHHNAPLKLQ